MCIAGFQEQQERIQWSRGWHCFTTLSSPKRTFRSSLTREQPWEGSRNSGPTSKIRTSTLLPHLFLFLRKCVVAALTRKFLHVIGATNMDSLYHSKLLHAGKDSTRQGSYEFLKSFFNMVELILATRYIARMSRWLSTW